MSFPGGNILLDALTLIDSQEVIWYSEQGRTLNAAGKYVNNYAAGVTVYAGSVQAVPRSNYIQNGLDFARNYVTWYVPLFDVQSLARMKGGDVFEWNNMRYQAINPNDWFAQDGWVGMLGIELGPATGATTNA